MRRALIEPIVVEKSCVAAGACYASADMRSAIAFVITVLVACGGTSESTTTETSPTEPALGGPCACNGTTQCNAPECGPGFFCLAQDCTANARFTGVCTRECATPTECPEGFACWVSLACGTPSSHVCLPRK